MWLSDSAQARNEATVSTLQEIGDQIRQARIDQGLSCDQLAQSLKMGSEQLQALEKHGVRNDYERQAREEIEVGQEMMLFESTTDDLAWMHD